MELQKPQLVGSWYPQSPVSGHFLGLGRPHVQEMSLANVCHRLRMYASVRYWVDNRERQVSGNGIGSGKTRSRP
jgi:hypothetical protein